ncbi:unnamed protein product [Diamesa hyperborea]
MDYNWNNVSFGTQEFNSSQNFFKNLNQQHKQSPVKDMQKSKTTNKENINLNKNKAILAVIEKPIEKRQPALAKTLIKNVLKKTISNNLILPSVKEVKKNIEPVAVKAIVNKKLPSPPVISKAPIKTLVSKNQIVSNTIYYSILHHYKNVIFQVINPNIRTLKAITSSSSCKQYDNAMLQKKKKEMTMKRLKDEEDKQVKYEFRAKPPPKFKKPPMPVTVKQAPVNAMSKSVLVKQNSMSHIQLTKKFSKECIIPSCADPERLKRNAEHLRKLVEKYEPANVPFRAQPCKILYKNPFMPKYNQARTVIDSKPFQLKLTERLIQRSEFDRNLHVTIEKRKVQEEVRRQQQDLADRKVIRQKTEFRAKPNPFK